MSSSGSWNRLGVGVAVFLVLALLAAWIFQPASLFSARLDTRTYTLRHIAPANAEEIVRPYVFEDREGAPGQISSVQGALTVRETPDNLARIERVLQQYDRPKPNVKLRFQLIEANGAGPRDTAIADVEAALRRIFRFAGYRLVAESHIIGMEYSETAQPIGPAHVVRVTIDRVALAGDSSTVGLVVGLRSNDGSMDTRLNARVGQTVVLGSTQLARGRGTLILTCRPELMPIDY